MFGDEEYVQQDGKYRGYVAAMEKALKNFEYSSEWPDLIAALGKLNKAISSHSGKYKTIPRRLLLSKRLSQCLHPNLPSGVHLKALETYDLVFKSIGKEQLAVELFIYSAGLFPLLSYSGISVRISLLTIYETHLLPLGDKLVPCLDGLLPAILLGMEETSDFHQRTIALLDSVKTSVGYITFYTSLWRCIQYVCASRQPAINYMLVDKESVLGDDFEQIQEAMRLCLLDNNILVQRASLELLSSRTNELGEGLELIKAALKTLLRRDSSLNRRLVSWLSNSEQKLIEAVQSLLCENDEENFRLLVYLFDKSELVSEKVLDIILVDIVRSLYIHNGSNLRQRSANLFFATLHVNLIWEHLYKLLEGSMKCEDVSKVQKPGSGPASISELCLLLSFLIQLDSALDKSYLPQLNEKLMQLVLANLSSLNNSNICSLLDLISSQGQTQLFNDIFVQFVTTKLLLLEETTTSTTNSTNANGNLNIVTRNFEKLLKKRIDLYDSAVDFEFSLSESMDSMSINEKLEFNPIPVNSQLEIFDCFKRLCTILMEIDNSIELDTIKTLLVAAVMVNSEPAQQVSINTLVNILPKIEPKLDLTSTYCIEQVATFLWRKGIYEDLLKLFKLFPLQVERVLITQLDYSKTIGLLKLGQQLDNNFHTIVLRCLDDLENTEIVAKTQSESFVFEFYNSIGVVLDPILSIFNETTSLAQNVLEFNEAEPEDQNNATESLQLASTATGIAETIDDEVNEEQKTPPQKIKSLLSQDDVDAEQHKPKKKAKSVPVSVYIVEASGKFKQEEIELEARATEQKETEPENCQEKPVTPLLNGDVQNEEKEEFSLSNSLSLSFPPKIFLSHKSEDKSEEELQTDEELHQSSSFDNEVSRRSSNSSAVSSRTNSAAVTPLPTPTSAGALPPIWKPNLFSIHPYNTHFLMFTKVPDHARCLYALNVLRNVMAANTRSFLIATATTTGKSRQTYFETLIATLLKLCTSFYKEIPEYGNVGVHVESMRLLGNILTGLLTIAKGNRGYSSFIADIFSKLQLQKTILYTMASLVLIKTEEQLTSTENILRLNYENEFDIIYGEIVRLTTCLIAIESETMSHQQKLKSIATIKYVPALQLCRQPLYLDSLLKNLANPALCTCHHLTLTSVTNALPFYGLNDIGRIVGSIVSTVCSELDKDNRCETYVSKILDSLISITHYVLLDQNGGEKEPATQQGSSHILYNLVTAFLPMPGSWKEKDLAPSTKSESSLSLTSVKNKILPTLLPKLLSTLLQLWRPALQAKILDLINPIAFNHIQIFINSLSQQTEVNISVDLVHKMKVIPLTSLAIAIFAAVKEIQEEDNQLTLLTFFTKYIEKASNVNEIWPNVVALVKDGMTMSPKCQDAIFCLLARMVADVAVPTTKQELKELQEGASKLIEAVSSQISMEKKQRPNTNPMDVLDHLSRYLPKVIDTLWGADALTLLTNIMYYITPHLKSKSLHYKTAVVLIANLSGYSYLRKAWKKEIFEHLLEPNFFLYSQDCVQFWKIILDNLFTLDKYSFSELIARVSVPASLNLFSSKEIEYESRAMLLKRLAFVIYSSPKDQYTKYITNIQERIAEGIKMPQLVPIIQSQVFLCFRVLLLRLTPQNLTSLWPIILHEILQVLIQMENDTLTRNPNYLQLYLQVCKLLELAFNLPASQFPSFQMHRWAFIGPATETFTPHLTRLAMELEPHKTSNGVKALRSNKIESLGELYEFLSKCDEQVDLGILENVLECDFVEL